MKLKTTSGFTLMELLITIAVIVILSAFIFGGLGLYLQKGRDQARKQELSQLQQAVTLYYNDNQSYACPNGSYFIGSLATCGGASFRLTTSYIKEIPHDERAPLNGCSTQFSDYSYVLSSSRQNYQLYAKLENTNDSAISGPYTVNSCNYNYRVENP